MSSAGCGCDATPKTAVARGAERASRLRMPERIDTSEELAAVVAMLEDRQRQVRESFGVSGAGSTLLTRTASDRTQHGAALAANQRAQGQHADSCTEYYPLGECDESDSTFECPSWTHHIVLDDDYTIHRESLLSTTQQDAVELIVKRAMAHFNIPSFSLTLLSPARTVGTAFFAPRLIYAAGFTWHKGFAKHGFPYEDPARDGAYLITTPFTRFRLGSVSKMLTAIGVMRLLRAYPSDVSIDDYVARRFFHFVDDYREALVTVRHLLCHASGLPWGPAPDEAVAQHLRRLPVTSDELLDYSATRSGIRLGFTPGYNVQYSSYGMMVLGRLIEEVTGMTYENWTSKQVLSPCGMTSTVMANPLSSSRHEATYYANRYSCQCYCDTGCLDGGSELYPALSVMESALNGTSRVLLGRSCVRSPYGAHNTRARAAAGGWASSAVDLALLMRKFHTCLQGEDDSFLTKAEAEEMVTQQTPGDKSPHGLGWELFTDTHPIDKTLLIQGFRHTGRLCGTAAAIWSALPDAAKPKGGFYPSICWLSNSDLLRRCRKEISQTIWEELLTWGTFPGGDLF